MTITNACKFHVQTYRRSAIQEIHDYAALAGDKYSEGMTDGERQAFLDLAAATSAILALHIRAEEEASDAA